MPTSLTELFSPACHLCPRRCGAARDEGAHGVCGANDTLKVARAALHMWEEPPISGEAGSGAIFFSGCSLKCIYCQNHEISTGNFGLEISPERLAEIMLELQDQGANNVNLVTATHYAHLLPAAIAAARARGLVIPIVYNTSGYERGKNAHAQAVLDHSHNRIVIPGRQLGAHRQSRPTEQRRNLVIGAAF